MYQSNAYPIAAPSYQTGFGVPQTGYDGGVAYGGYGGNGFTAKRAAVQNAQESTVKQVQNACKYEIIRLGNIIYLNTQKSFSIIQNKYMTGFCIRILSPIKIQKSVLTNN